MGYYIEGPRIGKAQHIVSEHGGRLLSARPESFDDIPDGKALVICITNGAFDAAAYIFDATEMADFYGDIDHGVRPASYVLMDKTTAEAMSGYTT